MTFHAQRETPVHSGEWGVLEVGGDEDKGGRGGDHARSRTSAVSMGSKGKGVGRPRNARRTRTPTPFPTVPVVTLFAQVVDWLQQQQP